MYCSVDVLVHACVSVWLSVVGTVQYCTVLYNTILYCTVGVFVFACVSVLLSVVAGTVQYSTVL